MTQDTHRRVTIERTANSHYTATNARGGTIRVGTADTSDFSPVELLLVAIGGCTAIDVDILTSRRAEPDSFVLSVDADKLRDEKGRNYLADISVTFRIAFPEGDAGDKARAVLPGAVKRSHDQLCTVSRTVELGTPVTPLIE